MVLADVFSRLLEIPTTWLPCGYPTSEADFMPKITKRTVDAAPIPDEGESDRFSGILSSKASGFG